MGASPSSSPRNSLRGKSTNPTVISGGFRAPPPSSASTTRNSLESNSSMWSHTNYYDEKTGEFIWNEMPTDVLFYLFGFLDRRSKVNAGVVCKTWRRIFLSTRVEINFSKRTTAKDDYVRSVCVACPNVRVWNLSGCWNLTTVSLEHLSNHCSQLRELNVIECIKMKPIESLGVLKKNNLLTILKVGPLYSDEELSRLASILPGLRGLYLDSHQSLSKETLAILSRDLQLEELGLHDTNITSPILQIMINNISKDLKVLDLSNCTELISIDFIKECTSLTNLNLSTLGPKSISPELFQILKPSLFNLQTLDLFACPNLDDSCLAIIAQFPKLRHLNVSYCRNLTQDGLLPLASHQSLRYLNVTGCYHISKLTNWPIWIRVDGLNEK